jgi:hypothetical protein
LQKARTHTDAEVRRRVQDLIAQLERMEALTPKVLTLHMVNKPLKDVIDEVARQTGYKLPLPSGSPPEQAKKFHTFHFDKVPFWKAFDQICDAGGLALQQVYQPNGLGSFQLAYQDAAVPFRSYNGVFKVIATGFNYSRSNNLTIFRGSTFPTRNSYESLNANFMVAIEPRLPILKVGRIRIIAAEDEDKRAMRLAGGDRYNPWEWEYYNNGMQRSYMQHASTALVWPSKDSRMVKTLKGVVPVTLLSEQRPTVVTDKLMTVKGQKFQVGGASFTVVDVVTQPNKQYEIKMSYTDNNSEHQYDYNNLYTLRDRITVQNEKGDNIPANVNITQYNDGNSCEFSIQTQGGGDPKAKTGVPTKLTFLVWVKMGHEVPFEFKDLPLP